MRERVQPSNQRLGDGEGKQVRSDFSLEKGILEIEQCGPPPPNLWAREKAE